MAPKKKGVSFVKVDKISVDNTKKKASTEESQKPATVTTTTATTSAAAPSKAKQAKKETSKLNRLAPVAAGKKKSTAVAGGEKKSKKEKKKCAPYVALQLRNLPAAFQEPQLRKFLSQFGVPIAQCFVQRTVKRATSRGLAYIRFAPNDAAQEKLMDVVLDEVRAMNLGGKTVAAKWVTMTRLMPSRKATDARRQTEYKNKTEGVTLDQHNVAHFDWVAKLQKSAKNEASGNKFLKSIGLDYSFGGFAQQVPLLTEAAKTASSQAQQSVKLTRLATAIGRRKGFGNVKIMEKVLAKKTAKKKAKLARRAEKKKASSTSSNKKTAKKVASKK